MRFKIVLLLVFFSIGVVEGQDYSDDDDSAKADSNATGGIIIVSTAVFIAVLGMSFFGHRIKRSGIRWFTINGCIWGLVHMLYLSAYYEKSPWPEWFKSQMWSDKSSTIATLMRCVFPVGAIGIMIEQIILTVNPRLQDRLIWQCFTAANFLLGHNLLIVLVFAFEYSSKECTSDKQALKNLWCYWYSPTEMLGLWSYGLFIVFTEIFLVLSIAGCCFCCWAMFMDPQGQRAPRTFNHPWLTLIWAHIPMVMYGPSFGMATFSFVMSKMMDWVISHGLISLVMGGGLGGGSSFLPSWFPIFDLSLITTMASQFMLAMPWFVTLFPLIQIILTLFCFEMYREQVSNNWGILNVQMFHAISCGRLFHEKPKTVRERVKERKYFVRTRPLNLIPVHQLSLPIHEEKPLQPLLQQNPLGLPIQNGPDPNFCLLPASRYQNSGTITTQPASSMSVSSLAPNRPAEGGIVPKHFASQQPMVLTSGIQGPVVSSGQSLPPGSQSQFYGNPQVGQIESPIHPLLYNNNQPQIPLQSSLEPSAPALSPRPGDETPIMPRREGMVLPQQRLFTPTGGATRMEEGVRSDPLILQDIIRNVPTQI